MKFIEHLSKKQIREFNQLRNAAREQSKLEQPTPKKKRAEKLSQSDLRELMGTNMDIFKRVRGAVRRK